MARPKGIPHTEEYKKRMSEMRKGYKLTNEWKRKIGLANSISLKGRRPEHLYTPEIRAKISLALTGIKRSPESIRKQLESRKGFITTPEHRMKLSKALQGEKGYWWKGGRVSLNHAIRRSWMKREWVLSVFKRDNYTCQDCGEIGHKLEAHHIKPFSFILDENNIKTVEQAEQCKELWDINNGRTLCKNCHLKTDTYGYKVYNFVPNMLYLNK